LSNLVILVFSFEAGFELIFDSATQLTNIAAAALCFDKHTYPLNYGAIECYVSAHKEMGHDANDAGRSVA